MKDRKNHPRHRCALVRLAACRSIEQLEHRHLLSSPAVTASEFWYDTVPQELRFTFDQDVSEWVGPEDHLLTNLTTGQQIDQSLITRSGYNATTDTAAFQVDPGKFDNGNYEDILLAPGVKNAANESLAAEHSLSFFFLDGDVTRDRVVEGGDYITIDANTAIGFSLFCGNCNILYRLPGDGIGRRRNDVHRGRIPSGSGHRKHRMLLHINGNSDLVDRNG